MSTGEIAGPTAGELDEFLAAFAPRSALEGVRYSVGCVAPRCDRAHYGRGLCKLHYGRAWSLGVLQASPVATLEQRFARYAPVGEPDECWEWTGSRNNHGYGRISMNRRPAYAHRLAYEFAEGPIPADMEVMHSCDNPPCVNPAHLSEGSHSDNMRDAYRKGRLKPPGGR